MTITAVPFLVVQAGARALDFYRDAFGAVERYRLLEKGGRVAHAEITIGESTVMLADEYPEYGITAPARPGATGAGIQLQVPDCDAFVARAAAAGATVIRPPGDEFYGERAARIADPFGHVWQISTTLEVVSPEEMQRRLDQLVG